MKDRLHPIRTVSGPGLTLAQGPICREAAPERPEYLPTDMHGKLAVRVGEAATAVGHPVPSIRREEPPMKELKDGDGQPGPGKIVSHSSDGGSPDVGIEVGLYPGASLYIGELARQTLIDAGVKVPNSKAGWWIALQVNGALTPIAFTCQGADGDEPHMLARAIRTAIMRAQVAGGFATADAEEQWIKDWEAGVYDAPCGVTGYDDDAERPDPQRPVTAADLADAFGCFWNAAIGESHRQQEGIALAAIMAEGFRAVAARLGERVTP